MRFFSTANSVPHYGELGTGTVRMDRPESSATLMVDCAVSNRPYRISIVGSAEHVVQATSVSLLFITQPLSEYAMIRISDANPDANMYQVAVYPYIGGHTLNYGGWRLGGCEMTPVLN